MNSKYHLDDVDRRILEILRHNARIQWREIGEEIHMSGQAVGERVKRLIRNKVIEGYYTKINEGLINNERIDYITIIMHNTDHAGFLKFVSSTPQIIEAYKTSGQGCYLLKVTTASQDELNTILNDILKFANYQVNSVITRYK